MNKLVSLDSAAKTARPRKTGTPKIGRSRGAVRALDPEVERWFAAAKAKYPSTQSSMIPLLQSAQSKFGYLPRDAMKAIAQYLVVPAAKVEGVASFYAQFRFEKPGRHRVTVCSGTACYVRGSGKLMEDLQTELAVVPGRTTEDGEVTLESVSCFGACALAPVVVIDDKVMRQQTTDSVRAVIKGFSGAHKPNGGCGGACHNHAHDEGSHD